MGDAYASDGERLDWVLWQLSKGMNLMFVTSRRDIDELMAQDDAAGLSALWCPSARNREAPAHREGSQGLVGSTVLQDADANSEGSNASSHRAPVDSNLHPLCDVPLGGTPMLSDDERFTVEHIRAFARGDSSSWAGWTRSLVAIIDRLLAARPPAPSDATGYLPPELEREYQRVVSSFYEDISPASSEAVRLFEVHQCGNARSPEAGASPAAPILEEREAQCDACNDTGTTGPNQPCQWCVAPPDQHPEVDAMLDRFQALCEAWHNEATYAERDELRLQILARMRPVEAPAAGTPNVELVQGLDGIWRYEPVSATKCYWRI